LRTLLLTHDGVSFDKIQPKQVGYFWTWINWKQLTLENREFGHTARSATSRFSFAGSSLNRGDDRRRDSILGSQEWCYPILLVPSQMHGHLYQNLLGRLQQKVVCFFIESICFGSEKFQGLPALNAL
jgi:hypothetical protein